MNDRPASPDLPHAYPFRFIDRIIRASPGVEALAARRVAADDPLVEGCLPACLLLEACAQTAGLALGAPEPASPPPVLAAASAFRFHDSARPGDTLHVAARLERRLGSLTRFEVRVMVAERCLAEGFITLAG